MNDKIQVRDLYKVFGPHPQQALQLLEQGLGKADIFTQTRSTVGVQAANFSIRAGEIFVIMGLSGSGKSTLVRMLNRLIEPTQGEVQIDGKNIVTMNQNELIQLRRHDIAMVFQSFALLPHLTVLENAAFGLEVADVDKTEREERAMDALKQVGLHGNADSFPDELSGGMQQRVGLARALATNPSILLMDEAFSALDPLIRREMQEELLKLQEKQERTVVFISHDLDEAMRIGDRIAMMEGGRVLQVGTPREILENPATDYIRTFFQDVDLTQVYTAGDVAQRGESVFHLEDASSPNQLRQTLEQLELNFGYIVDKDDRFQGVVSRESLSEAGDTRIDHAYLKSPRTLTTTSRLNEALGKVATTPYPVPVLDRNHKFCGALSRTHLLETLERTDNS